MKQFFQNTLFAVFILGFFASNLLAQNGFENQKPLAQKTAAAKNAGIEFSRVAPFSASKKVSKVAADFARDAQFLDIDLAEISRIALKKPAAVELLIPFHGKMVAVEMVKSQVLTDDFALETSSSGGHFERYNDGAHYQGIIAGDPNSVAAFSFFEGELMGLLADSRHGNRVVGRLDQPDSERDYIFYEEDKLARRNPFACHSEEKNDLQHTVSGVQPEVTGCVRIFFEVDYELFLNKGSVVNTVNYLTGAFNQMAALYVNESISVKLSQMFVWTTPDFYDTASSNTVLNQFRTFRTAFNADLAHHVGIGGNNYGGIAYLGVLCVSGYKYAVSDINTSYNTVPTYSWTVMVLTHETGHNLGSNHTQWCGWSGGALDNCYTTEGGCAAGPAPTTGGTIMSYCHLTSYGINLANGFGTQPGAAVRTGVSTATCLAASCSSNACEAPNDLSVSNISAGSATISWAATAGATAYTLRFRAVGAAAWTTISPATSPQVLTGLPATDEIEVTVAANCSANVSEYQNGLIFTSAAGGATCDVPTNLTASATSVSTATATWAAVSGAVSYNFSFKTATSTTWSANTSISGTSANLTGLAANTAYNVRVQTVCSGGVSAFLTANFSTPAAATCATPSGFSVVAANPTTANAMWNAAAGAVSYDLQYKRTNVNTWTTITGIATNNYQITGLQAGKKYYVRVRTICAGGTSNYTANVTVTMPTNLGGGPSGGENTEPNEGQNGVETNFEIETRGSEIAPFLEIGEMQIAPNPTVGFVKISLRLAEQKMVQVVLFDAFGKVISTEKAELEQGSLELDLTELPAGVYFVRAAAGERVFSARLVRN